MRPACAKPLRRRQGAMLADVFNSLLEMERATLHYAKQLQVFQGRIPSSDFPHKRYGGINRMADPPLDNAEA